MNRRSVVCTLVALAMGFVPFPLSPGQSSRDVPVRVPFVGCPSDGQTGPLKAPAGRDADVQGDPQLIARLALYGAENGPQVLGPRRWECVGTYGSAQASVIITPTVIDQRAPTVFIQATSIDGDTSGRFTVAQIIARIFPAQRSFVEGIIKSGPFAASDFPFGPFPTDHLTYRGEHVVEFETPARSKGLGTLFQLAPNGNSIRGVVVLTRELGVHHLALRLPRDLSALAPVIIRQFEPKE